MDPIHRLRLAILSKRSKLEVTEPENITPNSNVAIEIRHKGKTVAAVRWRPDHRFRVFRVISGFDYKLVWSTFDPEEVLDFILDKLRWFIKNA